MCDFSGKLIAWLDQELTAMEAAEVERHVGHCAECRLAVRSYREISEAFLNCYAMATPGKPARNLWRWAAVASATAAAMLLAAVLARPHQQTAPALPQAVPAPAMAFEKTPSRMVAIHPRRSVAPQPLLKPQWIPREPTVEVALPADAMFPPGAVPAGFSFIADVRFQQ
jgi:hypothetical protein